MRLRLLLVPILVAPVLVDLAAPVVAAPTCLGEPATIVGSGGRVVGTAGDDVIVSNGAADVIARGGDDLVCLTATRGPSDTRVDLGGGDDRAVVVSGADDWNVVLGDGDDGFVGGPGNDIVVAGRASAETGEVVDTGRDEIETRGGVDIVTVGDGSADGPVRDVVRLGPGDDFLTQAEHGLRDGGFVSGGDGIDEVGVAIDGVATIDNRSSEATRDGRPWFRSGGFEVFAVDGSGSLDFRGSTSAETVAMQQPGLTVTGDLGPGRDTFAPALGGGPHPLRGGSGIDTVAVYAVRRLDVDLRTSTARGPNRAVTWGAGFEGVSASARRWVRVVGDAGPNTISVVACHVVARGGRGDDELRVPYVDPDTLRDLGCVRVPADFDGGRGDDLLVGRGGDDRLVGGPGRDRAVGGAGRDLCRAERRTGCER